jgi:hypothetical protein
MVFLNFPMPWSNAAGESREIAQREIHITHTEPGRISACFHAHSEHQKKRGNLIAFHIVDNSH